MDLCGQSNVSAFEALNAKIASSKMDGILGGAKELGKVKLVCAELADMQMTPPLWQKAKKAKQSLDESKRGE